MLKLLNTGNIDTNTLGLGFLIKLLNSNSVYDLLNIEMMNKTKSNNNNNFKKMNEHLNRYGNLMLNEKNCTIFKIHIHKGVTP